MLELIVDYVLDILKTNLDKFINLYEILDSARSLNTFGQTLTDRTD